MSGSTVSQPPAGRRDTSWMEQAACLNSDPELFFPDQDNARLADKTAKKICRDCPVKDECRDWADTTRQAGMWGGTRRRRPQ